MLFKAKELIEEAKALEEEIKGYEAGVITLTGGYVSEQIVSKVVETAKDENGNLKMDKDGQPVKVTKYVPTDIVTYNAEENCYYINEENTENNNEIESNETNND